MEEEITIQILKGNKIIHFDFKEFLLFINSNLGKEFENIFNDEENQSDNKLLKITEVCKLFSVTKPTVYKWCKDGILKPSKIGNRVFYEKKEILELIQKSKLNDENK